MHLEKDHFSVLFCLPTPSSSEQNGFILILEAERNWFVNLAM